MVERRASKKNVFVFGQGLIGKAFIKELQKLEGFEVLGHANSKSYTIGSRETIGEPDLSGYGSDLVIVDCTASDTLPEKYPTWISQGASVILANKSGVSKHAIMKECQRAARESNSYFGWEATVGAGIPVIRSIKDLLATGDSISKIEATLSGSLAFILNHFEQHGDIQEGLRIAQERGMMEPDPQVDLSGADVLKKALILGNMLGTNITVDHQPLDLLLPIKPTERYLARVINDGTLIQIEVGLQNCEEIYRGTESVIRVYSKRFPDGLSLIGPGAGPDSTVHALLCDLIQTQ